MGKLLDKIKSSPAPTTRFVCVPYEEYELLKVAAWNRGERAEAQKRLTTLMAWRLRKENEKKGKIVWKRGEKNGAI